MFQLVPRALQLAIDEDVEFRKSLPRNYFSYMGVAFSDSVRDLFHINYQIYSLVTMSKSVLSNACPTSLSYFLFKNSCDI